MAILNPSKTPPTGTFVKSFNGRKDDVTLTLADVIAALGYTPADGAGINELIDDRIAALLVAGTNITLNYDDAAGTLTINSTGTGGGGVTTPDGSLDFSQASQSGLTSFL